MTPELRRWLVQQVDEDYRSFQHKLLPGVENYLGVRLPVLKKKAAQLAKGNWQQELDCDDQTFEEQMLRAMTIGRLQLPPQQLMVMVEEFVPCIDNWAVCDSFCAALRGKMQYKSEFLHTIKRFVLSKRPFEVRFAAVMLLMYYNQPQDLPTSFALYARMQTTDYYAWMSIAWGYSVFAATDFAATLQAMEQAELPGNVWNKALQKMRESRRISPQQKAIAAGEKRQKEDGQ